MIIINEKWKTIKGTHVDIQGKKIIKGPKSLIDLTSDKSDSESNSKSMSSESSSGPSEFAQNLANMITSTGKFVEDEVLSNLKHR